jgi:pyridoxamine 5'-phosphate oxidase-like protein
MGKRLDEITPELKQFIEEQPVFFVGSAPVASDGHVNVSPKGLDTFRVLGPRRVAYLDLTGSGNETASHVTENGRLTVMFCAFSGRPQILRLYCRGRAVTRGSAECAALLEQFPAHVGVRQVIVGEVEFVLTSCGYAVPEMELVGERDTLRRWTEAKDDEELVAYRRTHNATSIDGLAAPPTDG